MKRLFIRFATWIYWSLIYFLNRRYWYRHYYLWSDHWRGFRTQALLYYKGVCQEKSCKVKSPLQLHHLRYRLWHEKIKDVRPLCNDHHYDIESGISLMGKDGELIMSYKKRR